ncbi:isochorismatase family cysteine hydrolase [Mucilaginibacter sp.]|jgi:nicotinamidase-related amidase|uniref:cysteine hydrolase family protein n=1 Tax=Mucilaginibacter sp. TaxID=1882438 RepID=UPI002C084F3B|nr:isochorismatase family cysteine hydrolase [Mucilaginibacter sp.]HTI59087.1 isochorismatase family cysteine hydrolase [Mucilaginibacter sp.]
MKTRNQDTALLVMDMQSAIIGSLPNPSVVTSGVAKAITYARSNSIPVLYVIVGFRQGMPEISPNNVAFSGSRERMAAIGAEEWMKIHPDVMPLADEPVIVKRRVSAFTGSDLEVILSAKGIQHIILTGVITSGVVLSTTREAADKDYRITILSDACADRDDEVHRVLTTKVFPRQAEVMTVGEWARV